MKDIKFRAWNKRTTMMEEDFYIHSNGSQYDLAERNYDTPHIEIEKVELEIMQYTGLKDKNDVDIYEGDILKTFSNINKYTDSFAEDIEPKFEYTTIVRDGACFKTTYKKRPSYVLNENSGSMVEHMEVIGNIYDNPELLERVPQ